MAERRRAATMAVSVSEEERLASVFQNGLTFTLAYRVTSEIDTSTENLVLMLISVTIAVFVFVYWQGLLQRKADAIAAADAKAFEAHTKNQPIPAQLASVAVYPLELLSFLCSIANQVLVQLLATMISSWLYLLPPRSAGSAGLESLLPITLLLLSLFWLAKTALSL